MSAPDVLDLHGVAVQLGVTYGWLQRSWRTIPGFPPPYLGAGPGQRPRWALAAITDFKAGRRWAPADAAPVALSARFRVANDQAHQPVTPDVADLLAAAGG